MAVTPMMRQYLEIKSRYPDAILFYRLGDFYEMFYDDAKTASRELELTLTGKNCGEEERAPMCGVPFHSADAYIGRLVAKGYKVVICEQMENPAEAKGLVKRDIVRVVTPGTVIDNTQLCDDKNNFICAVYIDTDKIGLCFSDISTGEFCSTCFDGENLMQRLINELATYAPKEIIFSCSLSDHPELDFFVRDRLHAFVSEGREASFEYAHAYAVASKRFGVSAVAENAIPAQTVCAIGAVLDYLAETQMTDVSNIMSPGYYTSDRYTELDASTRRNLELTETMRTKEKKGSLLWVLDKTKTSAGARMLRRWVELPLVNPNLIEKRQRAVSELCSSFMQREEISELLKRVLDLDRLMTKIVYGTANARDLRAISSTASVIPEIKELIRDFMSEELSSIYARLDPLDDIRELIDRAIVPEPPFSLREGGFIARGYNSEADELFEIMHDGKSFVERMAEEEREKTGIKNLKISYNRVFGYYIEVSKSNLADVPDTYIRKQTLANGERYITEELKEKESVILGASDRLCALEYELFTEVRQKVASEIRRVSESAEMLAKLDCYISLAEVAQKNNYCRPEVDYGNVISIKDGRHPVVEKFASDGYFVPNDTFLDTGKNKLALITGPNMAGKSTYMRQVALIALMAQIGSFVPAKEARIGIVDKIFTRVGASDDLASGTSTFMLEMNEVAYILKNATSRSLIVFDEIGRGTGTFDGMSIARAVAEYTCGKGPGCKTLFATHYHELARLEDECDGVVNYNIAAKKKGDDITFLRKIVRGATDDSYGIEVAKLAGVPSEVIKRAKEILRELEKNGKRVFAEENADESDDTENITFDDVKADEIRKKILNTDVDTLTPIEALNLMYELKKMSL